MAKEKKDRNERLYKFKQEHPTWSISAVGRLFRVKPEVAWRIIQRYNKKAQDEG